MVRFSERTRVLLSTVGVIFGAILLANLFPYSLQRLVVVIGFAWAGVNAIRAYRRIRSRARLIDADEGRPEPRLVWPPRRPDDWGIEIQRKYEKALTHYQNRQSISSASGVPFHASPPRMSLIPSWEEHHRKLQEQDPIQIRWAQTDSGDWHKVVWGNRTLTPPAGQALPVFQSMQRVDNGKWVWVGLGSRPAFSWQSGPMRVEDFHVTDSEGQSFMVRRPCGHPSYVEPPEVAQSDVGGTASPMTDAELLQAGAAHPVHDNTPVEPANDPEPVVNRTAHTADSTHGTAAPLSDDELVGMGATHQPSSHATPPEPPTDPTKWAGVI